MIGTAGRLLEEVVRLGTESAPFLFAGFALAGLLHEFVPATTITRHLGRENARSVVLAALLGAPLPLCSCSALAAAAVLRTRGAGRAPTLAFLVSTPETSADSVALTYGLFGGTMALVRPIAAIATAVVAGLVSLLVPGGKSGIGPAPSCAGHGHRREPVAAAPKCSTGAPFVERLRRAGGYGFGTLLDELAPWIGGGLVVGAALSVFFPDGFLDRITVSGGGVPVMLAIVALSLPLYVCASASTPIAAALVAKGLSPGAALVFLLVGPATNLGAIGLLAHLLGRRSVAIYLGSIVVVGIGAGLLLDALVGASVRAALRGSFAASFSAGPGPIDFGMGLLLATLATRRWWSRFGDQAAPAVGSGNGSGRAAHSLEGRLASSSSSRQASS
jgi:uncharacterized membrane protein YraQ (UPF0718 family)